MIVQEAIDILVKDLHLDPPKNAILARKQDEAVRVAIKSMEKQIPKKPIYEGDGYAPDGTFVYDTWVCPCCEARYELDCDDYDFCQNCGQKIDWSEVDGE